MTDVTNAARTMLFNIHDASLGRSACCERMDIPAAVLAARWWITAQVVGMLRQDASSGGRFPSRRWREISNAALFGQTAASSRACARTPMEPAALC